MLVQETLEKNKTIQMVNSSLPIEPPLLKHINRFARRHIFLTGQSLTKYTTSQRRKFERDIYDYARAIPLSKSQAKIAVIYARRLCGEEEYDSDSSRLDDDEVDDSAPLSTLTEKPWYFSLDWSLAATPDAIKLPQTPSILETSNKRPHDDSRDSSEKRRKVNGVMTSGSQGADRRLDSGTTTSDGGHHRTEHIGTQENFSKHPTHTTPGHNFSMEQPVPIPGLLTPTNLLSSISHADTSITIKDKGHKGHEGAKSLEEGLEGTSSTQGERQRNIEESTSANEGITSKGLEATKEPSAAARALDELWSQEQSTSSVVKGDRCRNHSNDAHHTDQLASTSHLTPLDQQSLGDEQRNGEHAPAGIEKPRQTGLDLMTSPGDSRVVNLGIQHSLLGPARAQSADSVQCPEILRSSLGQGVQTRSGYTIKTGQKENQQTSFERYNDIMDLGHPPAYRSVPSPTQPQVHKGESDPSHNTSGSSPNNESDVCVNHRDHKQTTTIAIGECGNGFADGVHREADTFEGEMIGIDDSNTSHGNSIDADGEKSVDSKILVQIMQFIKPEATQTVLDDGVEEDSDYYEELEEEELRNMQSMKTEASQTVLDRGFYSEYEDSEEELEEEDEMYEDGSEEESEECMRTNKPTASMMMSAALPRA